MVNTRPFSRHEQRPAILILAGLLFGALLLDAAHSGAQTKTDPKGKANPKEKLDPKAPPPIPPPLKHTIASKDKDVAPTVKLINDKLSAQWKANNIVHAPWASDFEFIRRASLDIIGRIATPAEIALFLKDPADTRRSLLIDRLLASDEYPQHWADMWSNWLLTRSGVFGKGLYHDQMKTWLKDQFASNVPLDQMTRALITASGKNTDNGAVNFILAHVGDNVPAARRGEEGQFEMVPITSRLSRVFLGVQIQCAQCHPHPFTKTIMQEHFWGINAFLRQVERVGNIPMRRQDGLMTLELKDNTSVNEKPVVYYEKRNGVVLQARAAFLPSGDNKAQKLAAGAQGSQRRVELANYLIEHANYPRALTNRMWAVFFGRGIVHPYDDFNDNNEPSSPELLSELSDIFKHYKYDQHKLIRWICNSDAYNLSVVANVTNDKQEHEGHFSRMLLKSMTPEQLFESMWVATEPPILANVPEDTKRLEDKKKLKAQWLDRLVANFGDDEGNEVNFNGTIVQALLMMNGENLNNAVTRKERGTVALAIARYRQPDLIINELFLTALNRKPTPAQLRQIKANMYMPKARDKDVAAPYQDLFWALLNSNEFILNH